MSSNKDRSPNHAERRELNKAVKRWWKKRQRDRRSPVSDLSREEVEALYEPERLPDGRWVARVDEECVELLADYIGVSRSMRPWATKKDRAQLIAASYCRLAEKARAEGDAEAGDVWDARAMHTGSCAHVMVFAENEAYEKKLVGTHMCHDPHCPVCNWRKSVKNSAVLGEALEHLMDEERDVAFLHLVLTVPNCGLEEVRGTFDEMQAAFGRMADSIWFRRRFDGYLVKKELTISRNPAMVEAGTIAHPHMHVLLATHEEYFADSPSACLRDGRKWVSDLATALRSQRFDVRRVAAECGTYGQFVCRIRGAVADAITQDALKDRVNVRNGGWRTKYRKRFHRLMDHISDAVRWHDPCRREMEHEALEVLTDVLERGVDAAEGRIGKRCRRMGISGVPEPVSGTGQSDISRVRDVVQMAALCGSERFVRGDFSKSAMDRRQASAKRALADWLADLTDLMYIDEERQKVFLNEWRRAMGDEDGKIKDVSINAVRDRNGDAVSGDAKKIHGAVKEMAKYVAKDADYVLPGDSEETDRRVAVLREQLCGLHMLTAGGTIKKHMAEVRKEWEIDDDDLVQCGKKNGGLDGDAIRLLIAKWSPALHAYVVTRRPCTEAELDEMEDNGYRVPKWLRSWAAEHPSPPAEFVSLNLEDRAIWAWHVAAEGVRSAKKEGWDLDSLQWCADRDGYPSVVRSWKKLPLTRNVAWLVGDVKPRAAEVLLKYPDCISEYAAKALRIREGRGSAASGRR